MTLLISIFLKNTFSTNEKFNIAKFPKLSKLIYSFNTADFKIYMDTQMNKNSQNTLEE